MGFRRTDLRLFAFLPELFTGAAGLCVLGVQQVDYGDRHQALTPHKTTLWALQMAPKEEGKLHFY